jgi:polyhydroxyalkanoate synthesis regulator phasin
MDSIRNMLDDESSTLCIVRGTTISNFDRTYAEISSLLEEWKKSGTCTEESCAEALNKLSELKKIYCDHLNKAAALSDELLEVRQKLREEVSARSSETTALKENVQILEGKLRVLEDNKLELRRLMLVRNLGHLFSTT